MKLAHTQVSVPIITKPRKNTPMTLRTKNILIKSIHEYASYSETEKCKAIQYINDQLSRHYKAMKSIGIGLDKDKVNAGEIFLRLIK